MKTSLTAWKGVLPPPDKEWGWRENRGNPNLIGLNMLDSGFLYHTCRMSHLGVSVGPHSRSVESAFQVKCTPGSFVHGPSQTCASLSRWLLMGA